MRILSPIVLLFLFLGCVSYNHFFSSNEKMRGELNPKKYEHSIGMFSYGTGNRSQKMNDRRFSVGFSTQVLIFDEPEALEVNNIDKAIIIDSMWIHDSLDTFYKVLYPNGIARNYRENSRSVIFADRIEKKGKMIYTRVIIPDSIQTLEVVVPYYSLASDIKRYDTLRTTLHRSIKKYKYVFD